MPTIHLKPNSAEYADPSDNSQDHISCERDGCREHAEHKAPKHRGLDDFYHFCTNHIRDYNKGWNFFDGMAESEVKDHMEKARYGDRPTWRSDKGESAEDHLRSQAWQSYNFGEKDAPHGKHRRGAVHGLNPASEELEAMALFGLEPPIKLAGIKKRYKELAMKHHPDLNNGCRKSEELLKRINLAYTVLKLAYEKFDSLQES